MTSAMVLSLNGTILSDESELAANREDHNSSPPSGQSDNPEVDEIDSGDISGSDMSLRRVKVYLLKDDNWLDHGTGYCTGEIEPDTKRPYFLVRNELDHEDIILRAFLEGTTQYQRQQDTLIVWTDPSGKDIALSFQETEGCANLCDFIIKVQQEDLSPKISLYYVITNASGSENGSDITELITGPINYPDIPRMDNLEEILESFNQSSTSNYSRNCIAKFLIEEDYLDKLIDIFNKSESAHDQINLFSLSEIIKTLILYSESLIFESFFSTEESILGIIAILEYDAEYPTQKSCHRQFIKEKANFKTVIDLPEDKDSQKLNIFKKDFYLSFLKDVILSRFLDDPSFSLLNTLIHLNQIAILDYLKDQNKNGGLLNKLFAFYTDPENLGDVEVKRNGIQLLHQYVLLTKSLQSFQRTDFFSLLIQKGLLDMIKFALKDSDSHIRVLGTELLVGIIEQDISLVNSITDEPPIDNSEPPPEYNDLPHPTQKGSKKDIGLTLSDDMTLMTLLSKLFLEEKSFGLKTQAFEALKILLDNNIGNTEDGLPDYRTNNTTLTQNYFKAFYQEVAPVLFEKLIDLGTKGVTDESQEDIRNDEFLYQHLCELFSYCLLTHNKVLQRSFFLENNILLGVSRLLEVNCKVVLKLSAISALSNVIAFNDKFYTIYILKNKILDGFFSFFSKVVQENNLANSTCLSLLELIVDLSPSKNRKGFEELVGYIYNNHKEFCVNEIKYVDTGINLIKLYERLNSPKAQKLNSNDDLHTDGDVLEEANIYDDDDEDEDDEDDLHDYYSKEIHEDESKELGKNMFEKIQIEIETKNEKRQRDGIHDDGVSQHKKQTTGRG